MIRLDLQTERIRQAAHATAIVGRTTPLPAAGDGTLSLVLWEDDLDRDAPLERHIGVVG